MRLKQIRRAPLSPPGDLLFSGYFRAAVFTSRHRLNLGGLLPTWWYLCQDSGSLSMLVNRPAHIAKHSDTFSLFRQVNEDTKNSQQDYETFLNSFYSCVDQKIQVSTVEEVSTALFLTEGWESQFFEVSLKLGLYSNLRFVKKSK